MKIIKNNKKLFIGILLGIIFSCGGVYAAQGYIANQINYVPSNTAFAATTVAGAIDNLYEYAEKSATNAERMMKPTTWPVGEEQDFGNGIYGQRFTGNASTNITIKLIDSGVESIVNQGGTFVYNSGLKLPVGYRDGSTGIQFQVSADMLYIRFWGASSGPYDVWALYTKTN